MKISIGVREIAYFLYASGDLSQDFFSNASARDGIMAHQYLQHKYKAEDKKEYFIKSDVKINDYELELSGRIDGVLKEGVEIVLEEIKSTRLKLEDIDIDYHREHLAQLKLYGYMYCDAEDLPSIKLRLTYINTRTYDTTYFDLLITKDELKEFYYDSLEKYIDWINVLEEKRKDRIDTIKTIHFPYDKIRDGQRDMMKASYYTLSHKNILYAIAPTGIGKTMATIFSGLKSMKHDREKLFYLTGKSTGKKVAEESLRLLIDKGLKVKALSLTSKAKSCLNDTPVCDPAKCIYAKGYFDRLQQALVYAYNSYNLFTPDVIRELAKEYNICPFEFSLDLSELCDVIICDYNYVFDPKAHLIRYFDDSLYKPKLLIDEAHNLVSRARDMYSAEIRFNSIINLYNLLKDKGHLIYEDILRLEDMLRGYERLMIDQNIYYQPLFDNNIYDIFRVIREKVELILQNDEHIDNRNEISLIYFDIVGFLNIADIYSEAHRFIVEEDNSDYNIKITCLDAREYTYNIIKNKVEGCVLFSATLYPINYYMELITKGDGKYINLKSPFNPSNLKILIDANVSTKYKDREKTIDDIIDDSNVVLNTNKGNYIIFFPSYKYMELFLEKFKNDEYQIIAQESDLSEEKRIQIFEAFKDTKTPHLGLFVLGGSFSEGMNFIGDLLKGVIIVGVGLPQVNLINNLEKDYFDNLFGQGFDYAYTYPGFTKVIQAAGRVIRSESDRGIVILIDERYLYNIYKILMPEHWQNKKYIESPFDLKDDLVSFFDGGDNNG